MNAIESLLGKVQQFNQELEDGTYFSQIVMTYEAEICDMNSQDQLYEKGQDRLGVDIISYAPYRPLTIEIKTIKHQPTDRVTLRDTGDFHRSFKVETYPDGFAITATDPKTDKLVDKYSPLIFGLSEENAEELTQNYIKPDLLAKAWEVIMKPQN